VNDVSLFEMIHISAEYQQYKKGYGWTALNSAVPNGQAYTKLNLKTLSWYCDASSGAVEHYQLNALDEVYAYIALG